MRVLITRPQPEANAFAELCTAQGLATIVSPLMKIVLCKAAPDLSSIGALAFTSVNGVRAFAQNSESRDLPVFAVGKTSAAKARKAGFTQVHAADGDVEALAALISARWSSDGGAILHVAGATRAGDLVKLLEETGLSARREVLYEARPVEGLNEEALAALKSGAADLWVALFSPRSATLFLEAAEKAKLTPALGKVNAVCLSRAVADAIGDGWRDIRVAARRDSAAMIELMAALEPSARPA